MKFGLKELTILGLCLVVKLKYSESQCRDRIQCGWYVRYGYCRSSHYLHRSISSLCRRSCGLCRNVAIARQGCRDRYGYSTCSQYRRYGYCRSSRAWMNMHCRKTCGFCRSGSVCRDNHNNCSYWAGIGECRRNPSYMLKQCRKSCSVCGKPKPKPRPKPRPKPTAKPTTPSTKKPNRLTTEEPRTPPVPTRKPQPPPIPTDKPQPPPIPTDKPQPPPIPTDKPEPPPIPTDKPEPPPIPTDKPQPPPIPTDKPQPPPIPTDKPQPPPIPTDKPQPPPIPTDKPQPPPIPTDKPQPPPIPTDKPEPPPIPTGKPEPPPIPTDKPQPPPIPTDKPEPPPIPTDKPQPPPIPTDKPQPPPIPTDKPELSTIPTKPQPSPIATSGTPPISVVKPGKHVRTLAPVSSLLNSGNCGLSSIPSIVGGNITRRGAWPWMVAITKIESPKSIWCGGSLLSDRWVLSAAHCFKSRSRNDPPMYIVRSGEHDLAKDGDEVVVNITKIIMHEKFDQTTYDYDIALLRLAKPVKFNRLLRPICMFDAKSKSDCTVAGWGYDREQLGSLPTILHAVKVPIIDKKTCETSFKTKGRTFTSRMMCAGHVEGGKDSCQGDSGGPLMCRKADGGPWSQVGIVSWGLGCARKGIYGVYTDLPSFEEWIEEHTNPFIAP